MYYGDVGMTMHNGDVGLTMHDGDITRRRLIVAKIRNNVFNQF